MAHRAPSSDAASGALVSGVRLWVPFLPYALLSSVHVWALAVQHPIHAPTKLALMPLLALGVLLALARVRPVPRQALPVLLVAIGASWLGDGAGTFFPWFDDELPMMLLCFGVAHLGYMWLFWRTPGVAARGSGARFLPGWAALYPVAYVALMVLLLPHTGALMIPVALYGLVLVGTATLAARCGAIVAWGGFWFLVSDAILAFRLFLPEAMPQWTSGAVMLTYTLGQGLIAVGVVRRLRQSASRQSAV